MIGHVIGDYKTSLPEKGANVMPARVSLALRGPCNIVHNLRLQKDTPDSVRQPDRAAENVTVSPPTATQCPERYKLLVAYHERYEKALKAINQRSKSKGRKTYTLRDRLKQKQYRIREMILQVGNQYNWGKNLSAEQLKEVTENMIDHIKQNYPNVHVWGYQIHMDETTPHVHLQYNIEHMSKDGLVPNCTQGLTQMGISKGNDTRHDNCIKNWTIQLADEYRQMVHDMGYDITLETREHETLKECTDYEKKLASVRDAVADEEQTLELYNAIIEDPENEIYKKFSKWYHSQNLENEIDEQLKDHGTASLSDLMDWAR